MIMKIFIKLFFLLLLRPTRLYRTTFSPQTSALYELPHMKLVCMRFLLAETKRHKRFIKYCIKVLQAEKKIENTPHSV